MNLTTDQHGAVAIVGAPGVVLNSAIQSKTGAVHARGEAFDDEAGAQVEGGDARQGAGVEVLAVVGVVFDGGHNY